MLKTLENKKMHVLIYHNITVVAISLVPNCTVYAFTHIISIRPGTWQLRVQYFIIVAFLFLNTKLQ